MVTYYVIRHGVPVPVRVSSNGNLIDANHSMQMIARAGTEWPQKFPTLKSAEAAIVKTTRLCTHKFINLNHEEVECVYCGHIAFVPDVDMAEGGEK